MLALALGLAGPAAAAQGTIGEDHFKKAPGPLPSGDPGTTPSDPPVRRPPVASEPGDIALLRALDKMTGRTTTFELGVGEIRDYERLAITLRACRHPAPGDPPDAYAYLDIRDRRPGTPSFSGWMFASSPALSALDHPRYDVWVLSCRTSSAAASTGSDQN
jgi:hypothetical protein